MVRKVHTSVVAIHHSPKWKRAGLGLKGQTWHPLVLSKSSSSSTKKSYAVLLTNVSSLSRQQTWAVLPGPTLSQVNSSPPSVQFHPLSISLSPKLAYWRPLLLERQPSHPSVLGPGANWAPTQLGQWGVKDVLYSMFVTLLASGIHYQGNSGLSIESLICKTFIN